MAAHSSIANFALSIYEIQASYVRSIVSQYLSAFVSYIFDIPDPHRLVSWTRSQNVIERGMPLDLEDFVWFSTFQGLLDLVVLTIDDQNLSLEGTSCTDIWIYPIPLYSPNWTVTT